jgi:sigma-B regulation protein RsbU (phosphoserine phosphatase)
VRSKLDGEAKTLEPMMWATTELFTKDLERMERDLNDARAMQTELLPPGPPATAGIEWFWTFDPCEEVGGDLYDYSWLDERRLALYVIDVSGHGLPAALYSNALTRVVKALASRSAAAGPAAFVQELSREFPMSQTTGQYFTIQYGILDIESRTFVVTSAGHPGPAWISAAGGGEVFAIPGPPAGIPELDEFEEIEIKLAVGDRVLMYSDGLVEALNPRQEEFGAERLLRAFGDQGGLEAAITRLQEEVQQWTAPGKPADDRSAFGFQVVGP